MFENLKLGDLIFSDAEVGFYLTLSALDFSNVYPLLLFTLDYYRCLEQRFIRCFRPRIHYYLDVLHRLLIVKGFLKSESRVFMCLQMRT